MDNNNLIENVDKAYDLLCAALTKVDKGYPKDRRCLNTWQLQAMSTLDLAISDALQAADNAILWLTSQ